MDWKGGDCGIGMQTLTKISEGLNRTFGGSAGTSAVVRSWGGGFLICLHLREVLLHRPFR
jgi:hypothetical protein